MTLSAPTRLNSVPRLGNPSAGTTSMATEPLLTTNGAFVPIGLREPILRRDSREISLLVADEDLSLTYASRTAGERVTDPHVHQHTEAFYVLEGELTFEVGAERETITIGAGGFAAFMRGVRDGVEVEWDIAPVPLDSGLPADHAIVSRPLFEPPS